MYTPKKFEQADVDAMLQCMRDNPFASLVSHGENGLNAEHIPFLIDSHIAADSGSKTILRAHIAKANPLWKDIENGCSVLVLFQGENAYISPNWYPSKQLDGKAVPTWNYTAVHAKGTITFIHDRDWLLTLLNGLTNIHEQTQAQPWSISDAPSKFIDKQFPAIVGIEITVNELTAKSKLSQNQSTQNREGVQKGLSEQGHPMAKLIDV